MLLAVVSEVPQAGRVKGVPSQAVVIFMYVYVCVVWQHMKFAHHEIRYEKLISSKQENVTGGTGAATKATRLQGNSGSNCAKLTSL